MPGHRLVLKGESVVMDDLEERLEERYPLPKDAHTLITISQYDLELMRRTAYMEGWKAGRTGE